MSAVETISSLSSVPTDSDELGGTKETSEPYRYQHLLPHFSQESQYPPLTSFEHVDPAFRALSHPNPRAFLEHATKVIDLTPKLGTEIQGVSLVGLDSAGRDQLALEVIFR
jgi:sulfonate dioxygenase